MGTMGGTMGRTAFTVALLASGAVGAQAQTEPGSSGTPGAGPASAQAGATGGGATSGAAKAGVGAVQGVTEEAQKPATGAGQKDIGAVQGAGAAK